MLDKESQCKRFSAMLRLWAVLLTTSVFAVQSVAAQDSLIQMGILTGASSGAPTGKPAQSDRVRRITLEQVKQSVDPAKAALARLGQLSIEAARDHRLGVQADYYPKFSATFVNMHFSEFLGNVLSVRRPLVGSVTQVPIPLISQNQTVAVLTLTQPITRFFRSTRRFGSRARTNALPGQRLGSQLSRTPVIEKSKKRTSSFSSPRAS
jgi:hypothetical protein